MTRFWRRDRGSGGWARQPKIRFPVQSAQRVGLQYLLAAGGTTAASATAPVAACPGARLVQMTTGAGPLAAARLRVTDGRAGPST